MSYITENGITVMLNPDTGEETILSNFVAKIKEEHKYIDGKSVTRHYLIDGVIGKEKQEEVLVAADQFAQMAWTTKAWGSRAIIFPSNSSKEYLRTCIQLTSKPKVKEIYTHTGWVRIKNENTYLMGNCAINKHKRYGTVNVVIPQDLSRFVLPLESKDTNDAIKASVELKSLSEEKKDIMWMLLGSIYRTPISPTDFAVHITGRTGTFKSELASIVQSHWGECNARQLPASWSSTANALEAIMYKAKDTIIVCDDFIPTGTTWQCKAYQKTADQIIRAQGNQAGRARLTDKSMLQETMFPRGLIFSTGEDTPEGHSVRGRMMIAELSPGDITPERLKTAQINRKLYPEAMASYIEWLAQDLDSARSETKRISEDIRDKNLGIGHTRTPEILGNILCGIYMMLSFLSDKKIINSKQSNEMFAEATEELTHLAIQQAEYVLASDPADQFMNILRSILSANAGHIRAKNGGIPQKAMLLGWTTVGMGTDMEFKPHGPRLGWSDDEEKIIYLDANMAYDTIRRHSRGAITITRQTLYKRLREAGHIAKFDDQRQRNTVRVNLENATRNVLALNQATVLEGVEL